MLPVIVLTVIKVLKMYQSLILKTFPPINSSGSVRASPSIKFYQQRWELHNCLGTGRISPRRELNGLGGGGTVLFSLRLEALRLEVTVKSRPSKVSPGLGPQRALPVWWPVSSSCCRLGRGTLFVVTGRVAEPQPVLYNPLSCQHQTSA